MTEQQLTLDQAIISDHEKVRSLYKKFQSSNNNHENKQALVNSIIREISKHSDAEEMVVYPALAKFLPNGKNIVEHLKNDHAKVKQILYEIDGKDYTEKDFEHKFSNAYSDFDTHAKEEETTEIPQMLIYIKKDDLEKLATAFQEAKAAAPTHPHPSAPQNEPWHTIIGLLAKPIDSIKDFTRKFSEE